MRDSLKLAAGEWMDLTALFDTPIENNGQYGKQWSYAVKDDKGKEWTVFAAEPLHELLKGFNIKKGKSFRLSKKGGITDRGQSYTYFEVSSGGYTGNTTKGSQIIANGRPSPDLGDNPASTPVPEFLKETNSSDACCESPEEERIFKIYERVCQRNDAMPEEWKLSKPELQKIAVTLFLNK